MEKKDDMCSKSFKKTEALRRLRAGVNNPSSGIKAVTLVMKDKKHRKKNSSSTKSNSESYMMKLSETLEQERRTSTRAKIVTGA